MIDRITITERRMEILDHVFARLTYDDYKKIAAEVGIRPAETMRLIDRGWSQVKKAWRNNARVLSIRTRRRII